MLNRLIDLYRLIPGAGRAIGWIVIVAMALVLCYTNFGLGPTIVLAIAFALIYGGFWIYGKIKARRERQKGIAFGKALGDAGPGREELRAAVSDLNQSWQEALETLKGNNVDIYQLPWYILMGEPRSGKSTTLRSSDIELPIGDKAVMGVGGTKNCDWWFTEKGVILDTAGRYSIQDEGATDAHEWDRFLDLMAKHRTYCPINGVILVIPVDALLSQTREVIDSNAKVLSSRLTEIQRRLAIVFPVYVMITKCDLVYGFTQFFDQLPPNQQVEMFGWSNPNQETGFEPSAFDKAFDDLLERVHASRLKSLSQAQINVPDKTFVFPEEFKTLRHPLRHYLEVIFKGHAFKEPLLFRGFYFSSAAQEGQPIVKACGELIRDKSMLQDLREIFTTTRAFFVRDFYSEKVFPEEGLVARARRFKKMDRRKRQMIYGVNGALLVLGLVFLFFMWRNMNQRLTAPKNAIIEVSESLHGLTGKTFFGNDEGARAVIYNDLKNLNEGVKKARGPGFTFFKGTNNDLTQTLANTFGVLYLDRILLDMFKNVDQKLREFRLRGRRDLSSSDQLKILCRALTELQTWRMRAARDELDNFEPDIRAFLDLTLDGAWDEDLARHLPKGKTLRDSLHAWFLDAFRDTTKDMRRQLILKMVHRTTERHEIYDGLHEVVVKFYENQPELEVYQKKLKLLDGVNEAWRELGKEPTAITDYHNRITGLGAYFGGDNLSTLEADGDNYLQFDEIRKQIYDAIGSDYLSIIEADEGVEGSYDEEGKRDPNVTDFLRELKRTDTGRLIDPRKNREEKLDFPVYIKKFWQKVAKPYNQNYRDDERNPYQDVYRSEDQLSDKFEDIFKAGVSRVDQVDDYWADAFKDVTDLMPDDRETRDLKNAVSTFAEMLREQELGEIDGLIQTVISQEPTGVPSAPRDWSRLVDALYNFGREDFEEMTELPEKIVDLFEHKFEGEIERIYGKNSLNSDLADYAREVKQDMKSLHQTVMDLDALGDRDLASNPRYANGTFRKVDNLRAISRIRGVPDSMKKHHRNVSAWGDAADRYFRKRARSADPFPEINTKKENLVTAIKRVGKGFPIWYNDQTKEEELGIGQLEIQATLAEMDDLDHLFRQLDAYRDLTREQEDFLEDQGKMELIKQALDWAAAVEKLIKGEMEMEYSVAYIDDPQGSAGNIQNRFTHVTMDGGYKSQMISLNSPGLRLIKKSDSADEFTVIRFFNRSTQERSEDRVESVLVIRQGLMGFLAWAFDGSQATARGGMHSKDLAIPLHKVERERVMGRFQLKTSDLLPPPPNWNRLMDL